MVLVWVCCSQAFTISLAFQTQLWDTKDQKKAEAQSLKILGCKCFPRANVTKLFTDVFYECS
jgi:hypothetical protein